MSDLWFYIFKGGLALLLVANYYQKKPYQKSYEASKYFMPFYLTSGLFTRGKKWNYLTEGA